MTTRTPDFYRVARIKDGERQYWCEAGHWSNKSASSWQFQKRNDAVQRSHAGMSNHAHVVPVYVKVTRKPKLHDFGWALRRMREGKRVRRVGWYSKWYTELDGATFRLTRVPGPTLPWSADSDDAFACDWQLYEPEVGS